MKTVGIVAKHRSERAIEGMIKLADHLKHKKVEVMIDSDSAKIARLSPSAPIEKIAEKADLLIVLGGDGMLLRSAKLISERAVPIVGFNLGGLGFLTKFNLSDLIESVDKVLDNRCRFEDRAMIDIKIFKGDQLLFHSKALNEVTIHRGASSRMLEIDLKVDSDFVNTYIADGMIVSTPTGSTAYNLSANGPIAHPDLNGFIINPICPHTLSNRPVIISDRSNVYIDLIDQGFSPSAIVTVDGDKNQTISKNERILISKSEYFTRLMIADGVDHFYLLRTKLKWGEQIRTRT